MAQQKRSSDSDTETGTETGTEPGAGTEPQRRCDDADPDTPDEEIRPARSAEPFDRHRKIERHRP